MSVTNVRELPENWSPSQVLPGFKSWAMEIGCGKGRFLRDLAARHPDRGHVGLELRRDRSRLTVKKIEVAGLNNAIVLCGPMEILAERLAAASGFSAIHINFPDPWPKRRHRRRRLVAPSFMPIYKSLLIPGGRLIFVTDDWAYSMEGRHNLLNAGFIDVFGGPRCHWRSYPTTIHEEKFRKRGLEIWFQQFARARDKVAL